MLTALPKVPSSRGEDSLPLHNNHTPDVGHSGLAAACFLKPLYQNPLVIVASSWPLLAHSFDSVCCEVSVKLFTDQI